MWLTAWNPPTSKAPEKAKAGRHSQPGPRSVELISRILDPAEFLRRLGSHFSSPPCDGLRLPRKAVGSAAPTRGCSAYAERADHPSPLLGLAPFGVYPFTGCPAQGWALTPPFHPYPGSRDPCGSHDRGRSFFCDTVRRSWVTPSPPPVSQGEVSCGVRTFLSDPCLQDSERLPKLRSQDTT